MSRLALAAAGLALGLAGAAAGDEGRWQRALPVEAPGPVQVRLDGEAALAAWRGALRVESPDGRDLPFQVDRGLPGERPGQVVGVTEVAEGWQIVVDLGAAPPAHGRLAFQLAELAIAEIALEGSADRASWQPLARAELYRLGDDGRLNGVTLDYPPTVHRYLRLTWPKDAGLPALEDVVATTLGEAPENVALQAACSALPGGRTLECELELDETCGRLRLALTPRAEPLGVRAWRARGGFWLPRLETSRRRHADLSFLAEAGIWRVRLDGGATLPALAAATCESAAPRLLFETDSAGEHRLFYGGLPAAERARPAGSDAAATVVAGPEQAGEWPEWPALVLEAAPMPKDTSFAASWPVLAPGAQGGAVARLILSDEVRAASRQRLDDLRLEVGGAQLPYVRVDLEKPRTLRRGRESGAGFTWNFAQDLAPAAGPRELTLLAPGPFERRLRVDWVAEPPAGSEARRAWVDRGWDCPLQGALPCERREDASRLGRGELRVELSDEDDRPLPWVDAELTEGDQALLFVWPAGEREVRLFAGAALGAPSYDLVRHRDLLEARPSTPATLGERRGQAGGEGLPGWALPAVVGLAALVLALLLVRLIKSSGL